MTFLLALIPAPYQLLAKVLFILAAVAAVLATVHFYNDHIRDQGRAEVRAEWEADNLRREREANVQREKNAREGFRRVEQQASIEQGKTDEIAHLSSRVAGLLGELRNRPERPTGPRDSTGNPAPATACTGAELYRPDADFLVREAARADRIRIERDACHDKYDALNPAKATP